MGVLYRKYRVKVLDDIVGQDAVKSVLDQSISKKRFSHAYLLTGSHGTGKTSTARILAHTITGLPYNGDEHIDILELDAASNRRIDEIRTLLESVHVAPVSGDKKVYIIDEVHMLTKESFNALLKTIEEPPEHLVIIMATTERHKVPSTIISRAQQHHFKRIENDVLADYISSIAQKEKLKISTSAAETVAKSARGSVRDALSLLESIASQAKDPKQEITKEMVENIVGIDSQLFEQIIASSVEGDVSGLLNMLKGLGQNGIGSQEAIEELSEAVKNKAIASDGTLQHRLFKLAKEILLSSSSHNPSAQIEVTLLDFCSSINSKGLTLKGEISKSQPVDVQSEPSEAEEMPSAPKKPAMKPTAVEPVKLSEPPQEGSFWANYTKAVQASYAPLGSTLRLGSGNIDKQTLEIHVPYEFHQKKLESSENKKKLLDVAKSIDDSIQAIRVILGAKTANQGLDEIKSLIGGGEVVALGD